MIALIRVAKPGGDIQVVDVSASQNDCKQAVLQNRIALLRSKPPKLPPSTVSELFPDAIALEGNELDKQGVS